jgi:GT2 family glycosyltransferase
MKINPKVTIAIFNFNGLEDTQKCLKSLLKTIYPNYEIWVVDDGSSVDEISMLRKMYSSRRIKYISDNTNLGFSVRVNQVLAKAKSKYVVLLNNDTVVDPSWLRYLVEVVESDSNTAVCQSKLKWLSHPDYFEYAGACGGYLDVLGYPYTRGRVMFSIEKDVGQYDDESEIFWACGAAMLIKRDVFKSAGGFDEDLFSYQEEIDFCWRVKKCGYKIKIAPKSVVYHKGLGFWSKKLARKTFLVHRNNLLMLIKNLPPEELLWIFPVRLVMDYVSVIYYLRQSRFNYALAVFKAHFEVLTSLRFWFSKRSSGCNPKRIPFSILWNYYILGKKTYADIFSIKCRNSKIINYEKLFEKQEKLLKSKS